MFRVSEAASPLHANLLLGILEDHGIKACVQGEALWGIRGEIPFDSGSAPSIWVHNEADVPKARELIAAQDAEANPTRCSKCGYDLRGLSEPRCPECGTPFRRVGSWTCKCGEVLTTQFTHCWKCGEARGDAPDSSPPDRSVGDAAAREVSPNCPHCGGTGIVRRRFMPGVLYACAALFGLIIIERAGYSYLNPEAISSVIANGLMLAGMAVMAVFLGRQVRFKACTCHRSEMAQSLENALKDAAKLPKKDQEKLAAVISDWIHENS